MRVCIDARLGGGRFGGVEQAVIGIASGLSKLPQDDDRYLFLTKPEHEAWISPYVSGPCELLHPTRSLLQRRAGAAGHALLERIPVIGPRRAVRASDGTAERAGADVVHLPIQDAFTTALPSIYQPHDLLHLHMPELFSKWEWERREVVYRTHCARAETVIAMTSWGKQDLVDRYGLSAEKVSVVPWGSVLWAYPEPTEADRREIRARLSLPEDFVLYPAQTWPHKNHIRLLDALALIRDREGITIPLLCPGRQNRHYETIQARIRELGLEDSVRFPGFVSPVELRGLYELATALVFPSRFEGWGLPVCEAFSAGLPVASSSATSLPDLVGDAALLFDPGDPEQIALCVLRLWRDPVLRQTLIQRGSARGAQFSFDHTARLFRAHYRRLSGRPLPEEDRILLATPPPA